MKLEEAQDEFFDNLVEGIKCPCCDRWGKVYRWSLYPNAAALICRMVAESGAGQFVETKTIIERGLSRRTEGRHWGLIEQESELRADGGRTGWWRVTPLGERFVSGESTIPKYAWVYDKKVIHLGGPEITLPEALKGKFDYNEMMSE